MCGVWAASYKRKSLIPWLVALGVLKVDQQWQKVFGMRIKDVAACATHQGGAENDYTYPFNNTLISLSLILSLTPLL